MEILVLLAILVAIAIGPTNIAKFISDNALPLAIVLLIMAMLMS